MELGLLVLEGDAVEAVVEPVCEQHKGKEALLLPVV